jgi:glyoxylase-like metal-dependent hydrolase (beta-lactamase superfamily II)
MEEAIASGARNAPSKDYLPNKIVTRRENDTIDGIKMTLIHVASAHTSGDLAIYLPDQKIVISGDLIGPGDPLIHLQKNGSSEGWIRFVSELVKLDANTFVLGHADPETKAQVEANLKRTEEKRDKIAALVKQGKSLDEVRQALGEVTKTGADAPRFPTYTETTYEELTKK